MGAPPITNDPGRRAGRGEPGRPLDDQAAGQPGPAGGFVAPRPKGHVAMIIDEGPVACATAIGVWVMPGPLWPARSPAMTRSNAPPSADESSATSPARMSW